MDLIRKEARHLFRLAWPIMGAQLAVLSMGIVDTLIVGQLGSRELAALAMANSLWHFLFIFAMGTLQALGPMIAEAFTSNHRDELGPLFRQGLRIALFFTLLTYLLFFFAEPVLIFLKQDPELIPIAKEYLRAFSWGIFPHMGYVTLRQYIEALSDSRPSFIFTIFGALLNIPLTYALVFGKWGLPALGVAGAGYATAAVIWMMFLGLSIYVALSPKHKPFRPWHPPYKTQWVILGQILRVGVPLGLLLLSEVGFFIANTLLMGTIGHIEMAAHQISIQSAALIYMLPLGLSMAIAVRIGQSLGRRDEEGIRVSALTGVIITTSIAVFFMMVFILFRHAIISLFTEEQRLFLVAVKLLTIAAVFQIFDGLQCVGIGMLRGLKDTRFPLMNTIAAFWILGLPFGMFLAFRTSIGPSGLWWGMVVGLGVASSLHMARFYYLYRKKDFLRHARADSYGNLQNLEHDGVHESAGRRS